LSTREKMSELLVRINDKKFVPLSSLLIREEGRLGVVVTFLAIMELLKGSMIEIVQSEPFAPIHVKARTLSEQPVLTSDFDDDLDDDLDGKQEGDRERDQEDERDARY